MDDAYQKLAKHLDSLPGGFPETDTGVEFRILKRLFTPEEAEVASNLTLQSEPPEAVAQRLGMDAAVLAGTLEEMAKKGLIFRSTKGGEVSYMASQFVVGIWEYQLNRLTEGLIKDFNEYVPYLMKTQMAAKTKQLRVIPVSRSIVSETRIMPYEEAENIINAQSKIVAADCICRKEHNMVGDGCDKPVHVCLSFGAGAYYYEQNQLGEEISKEEALKLLKQAAEAGLVLQPGNSQKPMNICMCCGCCCQILKNLKTLEKPAEFACTSFYAAVNEDECVACGVCEEKCPMDAIEVEETAVVKLDRCIGCGVCAASCDYEAISLQLKDEEQRWTPPQNIVETYINIASERGLI